MHRAPATTYTVRLIPLMAVMNSNPAVHARIDALVRGNRVVLFMKGERGAPRCGFSAAATAALDSLIDDYATVDVLADDEIRQGIKTYGNWPTIPQLYIDGELVGGSDIIAQMLNSGELHRTLGVAEPDRTPPEVTITDAAASAIREAIGTDADDALHLAIDERFRAQFLLKPAQGHEIATTANGITVLFDLASAQRARGLTIDWAESVQGAGLVLRNPNAPPPLKGMSVAELRDALAADAITVVDVRPAVDRARAPFAPARVLEGDTAAELQRLPKDTPLAFLCHHGNSSRTAAEHFRALGFTAVHNVDGGIDAWSREIDPSVPRY
jgi:monothiol glutaredoxin